MRTCTVEGCDAKHRGRGLCAKHYQRWRYANDAAYRESMKARQRRPEMRARKNERRRARWSNDPAYRRRVLARQRAEHARRYRTDPAYRSRILERDRRSRGTESRRAYKRRWERERYHRMGGKGYARWRGTLLLEQGFACGICGQTITAATPDVDHIVPVSKGGSSDKSNLQAACPTCNIRKGNR